MLAPGSWGFYESYSTLVRVEENTTITTNNRRGHSYFRGVLIDLEDNYSSEFKENLLISNFWEKESCKEPNILGKFALGEVAYQTWLQRNNKAASKSSRPTKQANPKMGIDQSNNNGKNQNIPKNVTLTTSTTTTTAGDRSSVSGDSDLEDEELYEQEDMADTNANESENNNNEDDDEEALNDINFPKQTGTIE